MTLSTDIVFLKKALNCQLQTFFFGTGTLIHTRHQGYDDRETNA